MGEIFWQSSEGKILPVVDVGSKPCVQPLEQLNKDHAVHEIILSLTYPLLTKYPHSLLIIEEVWVNRDVSKYLFKIITFISSYIRGKLKSGGQNLSPSHLILNSDYFYCRNVSKSGKQLEASPGNIILWQCVAMSISPHYVKFRPSSS